MRLIDADFLIDCIKPQLGTGEVLFDEVMKKFIGILEATPTIDAVSVVHGEWIAKYEGSYLQRRMYCSVCGKRSGIGGIESNQRKPYCPNCGAKMDGERKTNDQGRTAGKSNIK